MSGDAIVVWSHEASIETSAPPSRIWELFSDVPGWKRWNPGIERIEISGPFAEGTTFSMQPPGDEAFTSALVEVRENELFTDETIIGGTRVVVTHRIAALPSGRTKITYSTQITGAAEHEFGPMVTSDFPEVLKALKELAENRG